MTPSENRPHALVRRGEARGQQFDTYPAAFEAWRRTSTLAAPYDIVTVATGRVIDPGTPVIDVSE